MSRLVSTSSRPRVIVAVLVAGSLAVGAAPQSPSSPETPTAGLDRRTWREYGGGPDNAHYVTLSQITKANVQQLEVAWTYPTSDNTSYVWNPLIVDGVAYVLAKNSSLVALDAATGREMWIHANLQGIAPRGINYWESRDRSDRRLIFQRNNFLEAIDARTGRSILSFGTEGAVNMREGFAGRDPSTIGRVQSSTPGKIFENLVILGSATGEGYLSTPGDIRAYDVITGKEVWRFRTIPHPGEFGYDTWPKDAYKYIGGTNVWGEITVDATRGIAYFPTGSPTYDFYGADRIGANLFGTSLIALDARTGTRLWHFQIVHHDLFDYDSAAAPQLTTVRQNGRVRDVVALAGKTGFLYVFDRVTGEPIWPIEERPVPQSDVPGERSWPTQPFPTNPPPFARQTLTASDINPYVLTPEERENWRKRIANARNEGLFTPPAVGIDTVAIPGANGGANWGTTAAHPTDGTVYVQSINVPSIYRLSSEQPGRGGGGGGGRGRGGAGANAAEMAQGRTLYEQRCQSCHGADLRGVGTTPTLVGLSLRVAPDVIREVIANGRLTMPPNVLTPAEMNAVVTFITSPATGAPPPAGRGGAGPGAPPVVDGPVIASGGAPGNRGGGRGGTLSTDYPPGIEVPSVRYYTGYGLSNTIVKPPYSTLTAYDLNSGTIKWQVPAGEEPRAAAEGAIGTGVISERSGILSTSTGLVFHAGGDGKVRAYDADSGKVLWTGALPAASRGIASMYEADGRQFLVVCAGQGSTTPGVPPVRAYVAFALPQR
jgi:quinoprotein glucose dehydrogenase